MQGLASLLESTGLPKTIERMSYGEPLTNIGRANVPLLKPETAEAMMTVAPMVGPAARGAGRLVGSQINRAMLGEGGLLGAVTPQPMFAVSPINLKKGIYKPELTMEEMLKVKDIPTVDRVKQSIDLVGEKEFKKMVDAQYKKYKPTDQDQEAMLVESVTLDILGKAQRSPYPQQTALNLAQQRAALPVDQGGLGLPANNTAMDRAGAMGFDTDVYHGTKADILIFDPTKPVFSAPNSEIANLYSQGANANIMPLMLRGKELSISDLNKSGVSGSFAENLAKRLGVYDKNDPFNLSDIRERELINQLPKYGVDRLKVTDMSDMGGIQTQYATPSGSSNIRSRFAAFDPFRKDVATATAMGVALPDLLASPVDQQRQQPSIQDLIDYGLLSP
jgi:competence protein ComGC